MTLSYLVFLKNKLQLPELRNNEKNQKSNLIPNGKLPFFFFL